MKQVIKAAMIVMTAFVGFTSCKKEAVESNANNERVPAETGQTASFILARNLVKKGTDSLVYNAGGTLTKVIYSPIRYVSYQKSGNKLTASTYENNQLYSKEVYKLENGRVTESVFTSYEYNIGISKTWWYDYDNKGRLTEKYNKDNTAERIKYSWSDPATLHEIKFFSADDKLVTVVNFQRHGKADKLKLNPVRSGLDPYLKIFGVPCNILATGETITYPLAPAYNFTESFVYTYDREGYPMKMDIYKLAANWELTGTQNFSYVN
jgi:hypothetical protein